MVYPVLKGYKYIMKTVLLSSNCNINKFVFMSLQRSHTLMSELFMQTSIKYIIDGDHKPLSMVFQKPLLRGFWSLAFTIHKPAKLGIQVS